MIKFNQPFLSGNEEEYIKEAIMRGSLQGAGHYDHRVIKLLQEKLDIRDGFLVHSCTAALEIAALAMNIKAGDEVILPSYTYVSTANAFALRGAKLVFVDVDPRTMCIDLLAVKEAITSKTKVVVVVHYGGVSCDMDYLMALGKLHAFYVVEDAAQALFSSYKGKALGTIGHFGCISCHESKNIHAGGEGGLLFVNDTKFTNTVEQIIEKGTNRHDFLRNKVERYTWKTLGSSYGMSQLNAAFLLAQLESGEEVTTYRLSCVEQYRIGLEALRIKNYFEILEVPRYNKANGHLFYIKLKTSDVRSSLKAYLYNNKIESVSHYEPLHLSEVGLELGVFIGEEKHTVEGASCLLRLPLHHQLKEKDITAVVNSIKTFFERKLYE